LPPRCFALVPCAGVGERAGAGGPKQYRELAGRSVVSHALAALAAVPRIEGTLVVVAASDTVIEQHLHGVEPVWVSRTGGATRAQTVANGLAALSERGARDEDWVLVHDAARCLVHPDAIRRLIAECRDDAVGGLLALPVPDTLKRADAHARIEATVPRERIWAAQTPQMFRLGVLRDALRAGFARPGLQITDEASAIEAAGLAPRLVRGDFDNLKVTWPEDFALAERLLLGRATASKEHP
jgi:2-C-methyl-D-erythritol 4-phosphate cytidylyltransferase/2-C-methyl-D-erythritol 4-phosphate cytidylyltransferase/2-C-methyl-D-erythritol 2,4-cyclodiphosphate synthase